MSSYYIASNRKYRLLIEEAALNIDLLKVKDHTQVGIFARCVTYWVYGVVISYVKNEEDAEEIIQDILMAGLDGLRNFEKRSSLKTWIYSIAINKSKDFLKYKNRHKRYHKKIQTDTEGNDLLLNNVRSVEQNPMQAMERREMLQALLFKINELPDNQRKAIIMNKLEHLSVQEIADKMGVTYKSVESLLSRAKTTLKKKIDFNHFK